MLSLSPLRSPRPPFVHGLSPTPHLVDATMFWSDSGGGVRRYLLAKRHLLCHRHGWRHTIVAPGASGIDTVDAGGLPLPGADGYRFPVERGALARRIAALRPSLVEAGDPYRVAWAALDAARACRAPALLFCHSDIATLARSSVQRWGASAGLAERIGRVAGRYLARVCERFDLVLAPSRAMQRALHDLGVADALHQPLGVDTSVFRPEARDPRWRAELQAAFGIPRDARLLLYCGRYAPEKNLHQLVAAVDALGAGVHLLALGSGPLAPHGPRVHRLPFEERPARVARAMASVDGFVHAGDQETFGLSVLEAMACGTPVAVRDAGGLAETVAGGRGIAVGDAARAPTTAEWAEAISALLDGRPSTVDAALAHARSHDWETVLDTLRRRCERAMARAAGLDAGRVEERYA